MSEISLFSGFEMEAMFTSGYVPLMDNKKAPRILVVDDSNSAILPVSLVFSKLGCTLDAASGTFDAPDIYMKQKHDLIVLDWTLEDSNGAELIESLDSALKNERSWGEQYKTPIILYTNSNIEDLSLRKSEHFRIVDYWHKPMTLSQISKNANRWLQLLF